MSCIALSKSTPMSAPVMVRVSGASYFGVAHHTIIISGERDPTSGRGWKCAQWGSSGRSWCFVSSSCGRAEVSNSPNLFWSYCRARDSSKTRGVGKCAKLTLNGPSIVHVASGSSFVDKGASAIIDDGTPNGKSMDVSSTVWSDGNTVTTSGRVVIRKNEQIEWIEQMHQQKIQNTLKLMTCTFPRRL